MGEPMATLSGLAVIIGSFALIMFFIWLFSKWGLGGVGAFLSFGILSVGCYFLTENIALCGALMLMAIICVIFIQLNQAQAKEPRKKKGKVAKAA